jgi:hypothetical protein
MVSDEVVPPGSGAAGGFEPAAAHMETRKSVSAGIAGWDSPGKPMESFPDSAS